MVDKEKQFLAIPPMTQEDVDEIIEMYISSGMSINDIILIGKYKNWYRINQNYKKEEEIKESKGKK